MYKECKRISIIGIVLFLWVVNLFAQGPDTLWTKTYGGSGWDEGWSVQQTFDGGYIIAGYTDSFGAGYNDVYIIKTNADGDTLWTKTYGGIADDWGWSVQQTSDSCYIISGKTESFGAGLGDVYLIKTYATGDTMWAKTYGGGLYDGAGEGCSVQQTSDGGYIIAGYTWSFGAGCWDVYLIKTNATGNIIWTKTYGGGSSEGARSVQQTSDGGYIIVAYTCSFGAGQEDVYLIKTYASGDTIWTKTYGGIDVDEGWSVQQTSDGGYIIVGFTKSFGAGLEDVYLIKTYASGDTIWTKTYGGIDVDEGYSVQQTSDGGYIVAGESRDQYGFSSVYLIRTDANGDTIWTGTYGGTDDDYGRSVRQTSDGGYIIAGTSLGASGADVYLIRLSSEVGVDDYPLQTLFKKYYLYQNYPNPFNPETAISFSIPKYNRVKISIYNINGQMIKTLANENLQRGYHEVVWNGKDENCKPVSSGIYFYKMETDNFSEIKKAILLK